MVRYAFTLTAVLLAAGCAHLPHWSPQAGFARAAPRAVGSRAYSYPVLNLSTGLGPTVATDKGLDAGVAGDVTFEFQAAPYIEPMLRLQASAVGFGSDFLNGSYEGAVYAFKTAVGVRGVLPLDEYVSFYAGAFAGWRANGEDISFIDKTLQGTRNVRMRLEDGYNLTGVIGIEARVMPGAVCGIEVGVEFHKADVTVTETDKATGAVLLRTSVPNADLGEVQIRLFAGIEF